MPRIVARVSLACVDGCCVAEVAINSSLTTLLKIERRADSKLVSILYLMVLCPATKTGRLYNNRHHLYLLII